MGRERERDLHQKGTERAHVLSLAVAVRLWKEFRGDDTIAHAELPALRRMLNDSRNLSIVCQVQVLECLPFGYSQILRSYVFGPSGFRTTYGSATLRCKI